MISNIMTNSRQNNLYKQFPKTNWFLKFSILSSTAGDTMTKSTLYFTINLLRLCQLYTLWVKTDIG